MALSQYNIVLQTDINDVINNANRTLARYNITPSVGTISQGSTVHHDLITDLVTKLKTADSHTNNRNRNAYQTALTNQLVSAGTLLAATQLININSYATNIYNNYCSCNCNNCCSCNCNNCCSCNCNNCCSCNCNNCCTCNSQCACDCNNCCPSQSSCSCDGLSNPGNSCMCGSYSQGTCVLPDTIIYTTKGPKLITEIENGDFVYNILGQPCEVISVWKTFTENIAIKKYSNNVFSIGATLNHKIPLQDGKPIYPKFVINEKLPIFHDDCQLFESFLFHIPLYLTNFINIEYNCIAFHNYPGLKEALIEDFNDITYQEEDGILYAIGDHNEHSMTLLFQALLLNEQAYLPIWVYKLDNKYINEYKDYFIKYSPYLTNMLGLCFKLLFNSRGIPCNFINNQLIFFEQYGDVEISFEQYNGYVYNLTATQGTKYIIGEIMLGDGSYDS